MLVAQKLFAYLLIAAFTFGGVGCPCPVQAGSEGGSHAHHQGQTPSPAVTENVGCQHAECDTDCRRLSADSPQQGATLPCNGKYQFDDFDAIEPETIATSHPARSIAWTGPPPGLWLSHDTPVRRFDRLLD